MKGAHEAPFVFLGGLGACYATVRVPDAAQRKRKARSDATLIRDRHTPRRSRVCKASRRFAPCCIAPGTHISGCETSWPAGSGDMRRPLTPLPDRPNPTDPGDAADLSFSAGHSVGLRPDNQGVQSPRRPIFGDRLDQAPCPAKLFLSHCICCVNYRRPAPAGWLFSESAATGSRFRLRPRPRDCGRRAWRDRAPGRPA